MKVELELTEANIKLLSHWASVGRTFDLVIKLFDQLDDESIAKFAQDPVAFSDDLDTAYDEIKDLKYPLNEVAQSIKNWAYGKEI